MAKQNEIAVLAGGCFWCLQPIFDELKGVTKTTVGFVGGKMANPSYREVALGSTGHAEGIQIEFDPSVISYEKILEIFFQVHDPTTVDRQGNDIGSQYRSAIFYTSEGQAQVAHELMGKINRSGLLTDPVVTNVEKLDKFYPAEEEHQHYFAKNPQNAYCQIVINPKIIKFKKGFTKLLKE